MIKLPDVYVSEDVYKQIAVDCVLGLSEPVTLPDYIMRALAVFMVLLIEQRKGRVIYVVDFDKEKARQVDLKIWNPAVTAKDIDDVINNLEKGLDKI